MSISATIGASVVVPSYRRPDELRRCLAGLAAQSLAPAQIIVVRRAGDLATGALVSETGLPDLIDVVVTEAGVLAAMRAGMSAAGSEIVAFIDDDSVPRRDWLRRLVDHFDDPKVGGVGGRDVIVAAPVSELPTLDVGRITRWGKLIGNHHRGAGAPRDVMVLKAAGMAFRRPALMLPSGLRGAGAQAHFEVGASLSAVRRGWRLVYDPAAIVDHYVAPRFDADQREQPAPGAVRDAAYNLVTCMLQEAPELYWRRAAFGLLVGDRRAPGLLRATIGLLRGERDVVRDLAPSLQGQLQALGRVARRRGKPSPTATAAPVTKPRVALLAHDIHGEGGMERACLELIERAADRVDFVVISARLDPSVRERVQWRRVPLPQRPFPLKFAVYYVLAGLRLAVEQVDLVHTVGAIVPNRVDIASVHFCHAAFQAAAGGEPGHASAWRRLNGAITRRLSLITERQSYRKGRVRLLAAVSDGVVKEVHDLYPGIEIRLTSNGVDHDRFAPDQEAYRDLRARLGTAEQACVALFVGGDWDRKGLAIAIEGVARARRAGSEVTLWVVGSGDRASFHALAGQLGIAEHVQFFGHRGDVERFYQAADVFVLPTAYETFCLAAFEAAACGLPLIVTAVHGAAELVGDDLAGRCVRRDPQSVATALVALAVDGDQRARLGAAGRARSRLSSWSQSVDSVLAGYDALLAPGGARPALSGPLNGAVSGPLNGAVSGPLNGAVSEPLNGAGSEPLNGAGSEPLNGAGSEALSEADPP